MINVVFIVKKYKKLKNSKKEKKNM